MKNRIAATKSWLYKCAPIYATSLLLFIGSFNKVTAQLKAPYLLELNNGWQFRESGTEKWMNAEVPGSVTNDLMANGIIEDVLIGDNAQKSQWIETKDWEYETTFTADSKLLNAENVDLIFEGIDTYATVFVNKNKVLESSNMFVGHTVAIKEYLHSGDNTIQVYFYSPVNYVKAKYNTTAINYPNDNDAEKTSVYTRKAAYQYGWDIAPRMVSCGLWRAVKIEAWSGAKITDAFIKPVKISQNKARYVIELSIASSLIGDVQLLIKDYNDNEIEVKKLIVKTNAPTTKISVPLLIKNPEIWYPNGSGKQKLYNIDIELMAGNNSYRINKKLGVRTIEVVTKADKIGKSFYLNVNGKPTYMKGVNCVPLAMFPSQVSKAQYQKLFSDFKRSNVNMVRIWGGGIYEDDYFYQLADENGILIWQDFMFSGAMFPSDQAFLQNVKEEATYNVKRLRNHPSIALWCGNNEIQVAWDNWGWQQTYKLNTLAANEMYAGYKKIFQELLPATVNELDSGVFYLPSSPQSNWGKPADFKSGDNHYWGVWHGEKPIESFETEIPRFCSEFGLPSLPEMSSIYQFIPTATLESTLLSNQMRSYKGLKLLRKYADENYPTVTNLSDFSYTTNVLQADAVVAGIAAQRASKPYCMGSLYWQANDCWPGITWSSIDYYGKWKALQFKLAAAFSNIIITKKTDGNNFTLNVVNDSEQNFNAGLDLHLEDFSGKDLWRKTYHLKIKANENTAVLIDSLLTIAAQFGNDKIVLVAILYNNEGVVSQQHFYFEKTKSLQLPDVLLTKDICEYGKGYMLTLTTNKLIKDVYLSIYNNNETTFSANYFDMLPGETKQVEIHSLLHVNEVLENLKIRTMKDETP